MRRFDRLTKEFNFIRCGEFHLSGNRIDYKLERNENGVILFAIVVHEKDKQFLRYVGRSAYGLKSCLDRIKTGCLAQEVNHRLNRNILFCLQHNSPVSIYYLLIEENDRIADQIKKQIIKGDWRPDWNL